MTSQILSAVLDRRPLFWVWSKWEEIIWVFGWSVLGGILAWRVTTSLDKNGQPSIKIRDSDKYPPIQGCPFLSMDNVGPRASWYLILALAGGELCLVAISFGLLLHNGCWVPLVPPAIAIVASSTIVKLFKDI